ncbi:hypothetical protein BJ138DRAFT_1182210 [Hygrophoropsis aurantiaca]|uniref:Uncharacterized protein n=1 Tax=Hygrophoropsis aurantiaca TaxID=72124 RepID=A0ACB8A4R6_9AGAM|nr:hypothetical protein BJ138DRAFT_1182210 [Hygrophoropsis aurantiaca]
MQTFDRMESQLFTRTTGITEVIDLREIRLLESMSTLTINACAGAKRNIIDLPPEVLCEIVNNLPAVIDVVRFCKVCKPFQRLFYDRRLWYDRYRRSRLPRPPGSRICQSGRAMAKALVATTRCHKRWVSKPSSGRAIHPKTINLNLCSTLLSGCRTVACGRWLLILSDNNCRILCRDLDAPTTDAWSIVYRSKSGIYYCSSVTAVPDENGYAQTFVVVAEKHKRSSDLGRFKIFKLHPCAEENGEAQARPQRVVESRDSEPNFGNRIRREMSKIRATFRPRPHPPRKPIIELEQLHESTSSFNLFTSDFCVSVGLRLLTIAYFSTWETPGEAQGCDLFAFDFETMEQYQVSPGTLVSTLRMILWHPQSMQSPPSGTRSPALLLELRHCLIVPSGWFSFNNSPILLEPASNGLTRGILVGPKDPGFLKPGILAVVDLTEKDTNSILIPTPHEDYVDVNRILANILSIIVITMTPVCGGIAPRQGALETGWSRDYFGGWTDHFALSLLSSLAGMLILLPITG